MGKRPRSDEAPVTYKSAAASVTGNTADFSVTSAAVEHNLESEPMDCGGNREPFEGLVTYEYLIQALQRKSIEKLWPIQKMAIHFAWKDCVIRGKPGSGKTLAYLILLLEYNNFDNYPSEPLHRARTVMILLPTIELCQEVVEELKCLTMGEKLELILLGSLPSSQSLDDLKKGNFDFVVSTPDCMLSYLTGDTDQANDILLSFSALVVDKVDQLLPQGREDLKSICVRLPLRGPTILVSDDQSYDVEKLKDFFSTNPIILTLPEVGDVRVELFRYNALQFYVPCSNQPEKLCQLLHLVKSNSFYFKKVLIFTNSAGHSNSLTTFLNEFSFESETIDATSPDFPCILEGFRNGPLECLIVTDDVYHNQEVNWKIDFSKVDVVVNFDIPLAPSEYTRRVDRTRLGHKVVNYDVNPVYGCLTPYLRCAGPLDWIRRVNNIGECYSLVSPAEQEIFETIMSSLFGDDSSKYVTPSREFDMRKLPYWCSGVPDLVGSLFPEC